MSQAWESRIEREPIWTDADRHKMQALALYESEICPQCGFHASLHDPENHFQPRWHNCPIAKGKAQAERTQQRLDEEQRKRAGERATSDPADGRLGYMHLLSDEELDEKRRERAERGRGSSPHAESASSSPSTSTETGTSTVSR